MRRRLSLVVLAVAAALAAGASATQARPAADGVAQIPPLPSHARLLDDRAKFLSLAKAGLAAARRSWWDRDRGWYDEMLGRRSVSMPLVRLWSAYQLFEAYDGVAAAEPSAPNRAAVSTYAAKAEAYLNPRVKPVPAYAYYPATTSTNETYYFDDQGWFGLAYLDAYRVTHDPRWVADAIKAFRFLDVVGWDRTSGGFWWETKHRHKAPEPLAAAVVIGAQLYTITHDRSYLAKAISWVGWADRYAWNRQRGLYQRNATDEIVMSYVEGLMAEGNARLCRLTGKRSYCRRAELLIVNSLPAFGVKLHWAPLYDTIYLHALLQLYSIDHNERWYALAYANAKRAAAHAGDARGLYQLGWGGETIDLGQEVHPGQLGLHAATVSLFAWLAAAHVP